VAYGNGKFVAVGSHICTSPDAVHWTVQPIPFDLHGVTFGNGVFVAHTYGFVETSPDGENWTKAPDFNSAVSFLEVAFGNGVFVGFYNDVFYRSTDGLHWIQVPAQLTPGQHILGVGFGEGLFCASGGFNTSTDGLVWTNHPGPFPQARGLARGEGVFVASDGSAGIATSPDGITWTTNRTGVNRHLWSMAASPDILLAAGYIFLPGQTESISYLLFNSSPDGIHWTESVVEKTWVVLDTTYDGESFLAVGNGTSILFDPTDAGFVMSSPDGVTWTPVYTNGSARALRAITVGGGRRVAVGNSGSVLSSTDGTNWAYSVAGSGAEVLRGVTYGNGLFVAVGGSADRFKPLLVTSPDGIHWTPRDAGPGNDLPAVTYGNGIFLAARWYGPYLTSTNGIDWQPHDLGRDGVTYTSIRGAEFINGQFVLWDDGGSWTSPDLVHWQRVLGVASKIVRRDSLAFAASEQGVVKSVLAPSPITIAIHSNPFASELGETGSFTLRLAGSLSFDLPVGVAI
ncbi:MAG TPA: hypothetical protein VHH73_18665, partial [Verrucomicrobiae bacterium]|nr:hypothetical protein [Verrucomicrobiae bacterium]